MTSINRRSALRAIGALSASAGATAAFGLAGASEAAAVPASAPASQPAPVSPKLSQFEAAFKAEWAKYKAQLPAHDAAEQAKIDAHPPRPESTPLPDDLREAFRNLRIYEFGDDNHPVNIAHKAHDAQNAARRAAYDAECAAIDKRIGWPKIDRAYERQLRRAARAADRVLSFPARSLADLAVKMRVHGIWEFDGNYALAAITDDIVRLARIESKAVQS